MTRPILLTILLPLFLSPALFAQHKYIPFPDSNAIWVQRRLNENGKEIKQFVDTIHTGFDTTLNGKTYHVVRHAVDKYGEVFGQTLIRQDTSERKVYAFSYQSSNPNPKEKLLYDFSIKVGDTVPELYGYGEAPNRTVAKIDSILLDKGYHYVYYFNRGSVVEYPYIEGIGSIAGLFGNSFFFEGGTELLCMRWDGRSYFPANDTCELPPPWTGVSDVESVQIEVVISPQPLTDGSVLKITGTDRRISSIWILDLHGRKVFNEEGMNRFSIDIGKFSLAPGMYFYRLQTDNGENLSGKFIRG